MNQHMSLSGLLSCFLCEEWHEELTAAPVGATLYQSQYKTTCVAAPSDLVKLSVSYTVGTDCSPDLLRFSLHTWVSHKPLRRLIY